MIDNYQFAELFWSYVIQRIPIEKFQQKTKIYWGHSEKLGATNGTFIEYSNYVEWFIRNVPSIPTTLHICQSANQIFPDTKQMKDLGGNYLPFLSIPLPSDRIDWQQIFHFQTKLSISDYCHLLRKIHDDERNFRDNLDRIQMIYSSILIDILSYTDYQTNFVKSQRSILYLLSEDNQWKLAEELYLYLDDHSTSNQLNEILPCLKMDFNNRKHPNLVKFAQLFGIAQMTINDLKFDEKTSVPAEQFRKKLIEILPFMKKWLTKLAFSSNILLSIDEQEVQFLELDEIKFYFKEKIIQEKNVYFDEINRKFYLTRPWNSETTFIDLPNKLCQLFHIEGFEDKIRFLLRADREEIVKHFQRLSIQLPIEIQTTNLPVKKEQTIVDKTPTSDNSRENIESPKTIINPSCKTSSIVQSMSLHHIDHGNLFLDEDFHWILSLYIGWIHACFNKFSINQYIEIIDLSQINLSHFKPLHTSGRYEENDHSKHRSTGYLGEWIVYQYLQAKYPSQTNSIFLKWENENGESNRPYDITLIENRKNHYIEVKSTKKPDEDSFHVSINQIEAICEYRQYYHIYFVNISNKKLIILKNVRHCLEQENLSCSLTIRSQLTNKITETN